MFGEKNSSARYLTTLLIDRIPEISDPMQAEESSWRDYGLPTIGPDLAFSRVLAPFTIDRLKSTEGTGDDVLLKIFAFLEELMSSEDDAALSAVGVSFGEELLADSEALSHAYEYMGPQLRDALTLMQQQRTSLWQFRRLFRR